MKTCGGFDNASNQYLDNTVVHHTSRPALHHRHQRVSWKDTIVTITPTTRSYVAGGALAAVLLLGVSACGSSPGTPPATSAPPASSQPAPSQPAAGASSAGASSPAMSGSPTSSAAAVTIHIQSFAYGKVDPVAAGSKVTVMNMDKEAHTVTADDGSFDAVVKGGESVTFTAPAKAGTYSYHCTYHANMKGQLTVK